MSQNIDQYFSERLAKTHYENFPVASFLLPKKARKDIYHVYTFARVNDDIADDAELDSKAKLDLLMKVENDLISKNYENKLIRLILPVIEKWKLDEKHFTNLLAAFKQDSVQQEYEDFNDLLEYSKLSANPVGQIMLQFFKQSKSETIYYSDLICTGLQLINFWQDISIDKKMGRYYVPISMMKKYNLDLNEFYFGEEKEAHALILDELLSKTEDIFNEGKNLIPLLKGRLKFEIFFIWHSANRIMKKLKKLNVELIRTRPKLKK